MNHSTESPLQLINKLISAEGASISEGLDHLLQNDAQFQAQFDNYLTVQLRQQYAAALQELNTLMQNPEREREDVSKLTSKVHSSGIPALEHLPALIELERTTRQAGGRAYSRVEEMVFTDLTRLIKKDEFVQNESAVEQLLIFLEEAFRYTRKYDSFATQRRNNSLKMAASIATRTGNDRALALLHEALAHPTAKIRGVAVVVIYEAYQWLGCDIPASLIDRFRQMADTDRTKKVRQTAQAVLQRLEFITDN